MTEVGSHIDCNASDKNNQDAVEDRPDTLSHDLSYNQPSISTSITVDSSIETICISPDGEIEKSKHKRKKFRFYDSYIPKILKCSFENHGITSDAKQQLNSILIIFSKKLAEISLRLTDISGKRTLSAKEVKGATEIFLSGELKNHAVAEGTKAITQYAENTAKGVSRQTKAGIIFPPSVTEKFLRRFDTSLVMVTHTAPVFLAAVLEYICMEIVELASLLAKEERRIRITVSDIESSVKNDTELLHIFSNNNIKFLGGSVQQWIHPVLVKKQSKSETNSGKMREKVNDKKSKSGTLAIKDIRRLQKMGNTLIFARQPFEKFVRQIINEHKDNIKISKNVFNIIQYVVEDYLVHFLADANAAAIHAGRVKLMIQDIDFIRSQRDGNRSTIHRPQNKVPIVLSKPTISFTEINILSTALESQDDHHEQWSTDLLNSDNGLENSDIEELLEECAPSENDCIATK